MYGSKIEKKCFYCEKPTKRSDCYPNGHFFF